MVAQLLLTIIFVLIDIAKLPAVFLFHILFSKKCLNTAKPRVAIIGGGIAGCGAAFTLAKAGRFETVLFEARDVLGGNAKTHEWKVCDGVVANPALGLHGTTSCVRTGLSVLAWPPSYFKNYESLLRVLKIETEKVRPKFFVAVENKDHDVVVSFKQGMTNDEWADDMRRWDRAVAAIRFFNSFCSVLSSLLLCFLLPFEKIFSKKEKFFLPSRPDDPSFYRVCLWNPLNILSARRVCGFFGVSTNFWDTVVVGVYSSSFLTTKLDGLPAMILPALDDIISVGNNDPHKVLHTWKESSRGVFDGLESVIKTSGGKILTRSIIQSVERCNSKWCVSFRQKSEKGGECDSISFRESHELQRLYFDYVVFACPSQAVDQMTNTTENRNVGFRRPLFEAIVPNIAYENERDVTFTTGHVHSNRDALPECLRQEIIAGKYTNYIQHNICTTEKTVASFHQYLENTFIFGTWVPEAVRCGKKCSQQFGTPEVLDMMVTYNPAPSRKDMFMPITIDTRHRKCKGSSKQSNVPLEANQARNTHSTQMLVDNQWAHPELSLKNLLLSSSMPFLQGGQDAFYCGSYATPGNGHDLSFLSGVIVADALARKATGEDSPGRFYPFAPHEAEAGAYEDFKNLSQIMLRGLL